MQYEHFLKDNFPDLQVVGENYPPSPLRLQLNRMVSVVKIIVVGSIIAGPAVFGTFGRDPPTWFLWTQENKVSLRIFSLKIESLRHTCNWNEFSSHHQILNYTRDQQVSFKMNKQTAFMV